MLTAKKVFNSFDKYFFVPSGHTSANDKVVYNSLNGYQHCHRTIIV